MEINGDYVFSDACPHCGEMFALSVQEYATTMYYVRCDKCMSRGPLAGTPKIAVKQWNSRTKPQTYSQSSEGAPF